MVRTIPIVSREELEQLSTKALLGRLARLRSLEDAPDGSTWTADEIAAATGIAFKQTLDWQHAYNDVKAMLGLRENVPSGADRRQSRHARAARNNTSEHRPGR